EEPEGALGEAVPTAKETLKVELADTPDEATGQTLGRYKLLEKIGEGGCGVVYVAEQAEPVRRRVALKVIKLGMDTKQVVARFEAERQALAMMDHPNIAKVLDAGSTETGRPYFVMELVRGIRITDYCDQHNLPTQDRLDLFIKICQAIQHAHQKGIIHRDIKPSNILVTLHDGVPVPKVIDFGIAKATEGRLTDATVYTQLHQFIGTPAYMSPEQAEMSGLDIDTRSDIYSLGVLLFELLAGSTPFDPKELMAAGIDEMRKTIREKEPPRPSTRLATLGADQLTTTAKRRSSDAPRLIHLLKGDLDWIVMKCLEKDPARRYETANGLAADIKRHLNYEPVVARPPSSAYKVSKFVRRNKLAVAAGTAVLLALVLGLGSATVMFFRERAANRRALEEVRARLVERAMNAAMSGNRDAVQQALEAAKAENISGGQLAIVEGLRDLASGNPEGAVKHLGEATKSLPNSAAAHALLATAFVYAQDPENHYAALANLEKFKEQTPEDYLFKGQALSLKGDGLRLLDHAVESQPTALAYMLRAEARAILAMHTNDIEAALKDVAVAKTKTLSQKHVTLLVNSCLTHLVAAEIYRRAGNIAQSNNHLGEAEKDGQQLELFSENSHALRWRIWQLESADLDQGSDRAFEYANRLLSEHKVRQPLLQMSYGTALLIRGQVRKALEVYNSAPQDLWIDSMRPFALFELPDHRKEFEKELARYRERYPGPFLESTVPSLLLYAAKKQEAKTTARMLADQPERFNLLPLGHQREVNYLAGRLDEKAFLNAAQGSLGEACWAHCLIGFQNWADGDHAGAAEHFRQAIDTRAFTSGPTYYWAQVALAQLKRHPTWPPEEPAKE
ncbi:MAG TPA: protein kinase, partial [Verrucomicrobiae bacterium]